MYRLIVRIGLLVIVILNSSLLRALDFDYSLFSSTTYNDNFNQNLNDPSGFALNAGLNFRANTDQNSDWIFNVTGTYSKDFFFIDELQDQEIKLLVADINYSSKSSNFTLLVRDDLSQTPQNRTSTQSVGNLTDVNTATIRPSYFIKLSPVNRLFFDVTYIDSSRKDQSAIVADGFSFDTISLEKSIRFEKKINPTNDLSLVVNSTDNDLESSSGGTPIDFVQEDAFVRWVARGRYNKIQLEVGKSRITDDFDNVFNINLFNGLYKRTINSTQEIEFNYRKGFYVTLNNNFIDNTVNVGNDSFSSAQKLTSKTLVYSANETFLNLSISLFDLNFSGTSFSSAETRSGGEVTASYSMSRFFSTAPDTGITLSYRKSSNNFNNINSSNEIKTKIDIVELGFNYAYSPTLMYRLEISSRNSSSNNPNNQLNGGDSNSITIGFRYTPNGRVQE